jgi:alanyl aminopeptidase
LAGAVSRPERWGARLCAAWVACAACGAPPPPRPEPDVHEVEPPSSDWDGWLDSDVVPLRYSIDLRVVPAHDRFEGSASIRVRLASPRRTIRLHGRGLEVIDAFVEHRERRLVARYTGQRDDESYARIDLDEPVSGEVTLVFRYRAPFTPYEGLSRVDDGDERYVFSHLPPIAARTVFPCFDEPRFKAPFELTLRTQPTDVAISNAPIVSTNDADGMRVSVFAPTEPLPTYLFALAVGPFDVVERHIPPNEIRSRAISFRGVALHREGPELRAVMAETPRYLAALERYLGIPYPYAKLDFLANPDAEYAGMENPGAVVFDSDVILTSDRRLSDESRSVVIHELAHQWFGDYVTTASWQDLWLNEGVATFLDARIREDLAPRSGVDLDRAH